MNCVDAIPPLFSSGGLQFPADLEHPAFMTFICRRVCSFRSAALGAITAVRSARVRPTVGEEAVYIIHRRDFAHDRGNLPGVETREHAGALDPRAFRLRDRVAPLL